jgi:hypothetical protein
MMACSEKLCGWIPDPETKRLDDQIKGYIWWCGDEYCDCSEGCIVFLRRNEHGFYNLHTLWSGKFYTDGEGWAETKAELNHMAQHLRRHHNEFYHRIQWPWTNKEK